MPSLIAWLDYSEDQRHRMREVIDLFRESDTLDELGIGQVRDAFGDLLFPGLSTTQTRAGRGAPGKAKPPAEQGVCVVAGAGFEPATFGL